MISYRVRCGILLTISVLVAGCGLAEYEEKMVKAQKKQDVVDERNKHLGEPAEVAPITVPGSNQPPIDVYFRLPRGIDTKSYLRWGEVFQQFGREPWRRPKPGVMPPPESPFLDVNIAVLPPGDWKEFTDRAQQGLQGMAHTEFTRAPKTPHGRAPMDFQTSTYTDTGQIPTSYIVYLHQAPQARVAIVFHTYKDKATSAEVTKAIDLCLQTLAVGNEAAAERQKFKSP